MESAPWRYNYCPNTGIAGLNPGRDLDVSDVGPCSAFPHWASSLSKCLNQHFWNCGIHTSTGTIAACQYSLFVLFSISGWRIFSNYCSILHQRFSQRCLWRVTRHVVRSNITPRSLWSMHKRRKKPAWSPRALLAICLAYSSTLKMEAVCSSKISADFRRTTLRYNPIRHNH
jgi:hypothetical protein